MHLFIRFLIKILKSSQESGEGTDQTYIIIHRPYDCLAAELKFFFKGQADVTVKVERRYQERRTKKESYLSERRIADRRKSKEELLEVVIST